MSWFIIFFIYLSFLLDFVFIPIPSEASTRAILNQAENRFSTRYLLLRLLHLGLLLLWVFPLVFAALMLFRANAGTYWLIWPGITVAILGRIITLLGSLTIRTSPPGQLIEHSIFSMSRHPIVFGLHLTLFGLLCTTGSITALIIYPATLVYFDKKVQLEEQALIEQFGEDYSAYAAKTSRYLTVPRFGLRRV